MQDTHHHDSLSFGDALFLYLERQGMPLNVASVSIFEGEIPFESCFEFVRSKLPLIPRYRQRVVAPPFQIGLPAWEWDPKFDLSNHVREVTLRRGTEAELKQVAARILSANMDRNRPLWDLTLVCGLKGGRTALITRLHHCMADGISGVGLMNVLLDPSPVAPPARKAGPLPVPPPRDGASLLVDGVIQSCFSTVQQVFTVYSELLNMAQHVVATSERPPEEEPAAATPGFNSAARVPSAAELTGLLPELASPPERLPFNVVCRGPQKFHWAEIPLDEIKAIKNAWGATVNDVVLAVVTSTVRRYAELHRLRLRGRMLRIIVPVSVRGKGKVNELGNRITFLPVSVPLDIRRPEKLVLAIRERMGLLKNAHLAELVGLAGTLIGAIPTPLQAMVGPIASQLPLSVCNLICTNVPGPKMPLYLIGHKMLTCYPYVPIGGEMGMNCAVLTYNGTAFFGFTGDVHAIPDLDCLGKFLQESFAELRKAAGVRASRTPAPHKDRNKDRKKTVKAPAAAAAETAPVAETPAAPEVIPFPPQEASAPEPAPAPPKAFRAAIGAD